MLRRLSFARSHRVKYPDTAYVSRNGYTAQHITNENQYMMFHTITIAVSVRYTNGLWHAPLSLSLELHSLYTLLTLLLTLLLMLLLLLLLLLLD